MLDRLQHLPVGALVPLILLATLALAGIWAIAHSIRAGRRHRIPAAPDNQPGHDEGLLQLCRLIALTKPRKEKP